ncbi:MAG: flagellar biosynthesis protein FliQ [Rhodothermaceae bacterium]|nr:flagellar biosynthesis protein FliQ [Rhodothermaceae bacterium]
MNSDVALFWVQEAIKVAIMVIGPLLGTALVVGLIVSLFQAITSIQEMTLAFIPKILAIALILLFFSPWMLEILTDFTTGVMNFIPQVSK